MHFKRQLNCLSDPPATSTESDLHMKKKSSTSLLLCHEFVYYFLLRQCIISQRCCLSVKHDALE